MSTRVEDWEAFKRAGAAGGLNVRLMSLSVAARNRSPPCRSRPAGSTAIAFARSGSNCSPTERSDRAARGSSSLMATNLNSRGLQFHSDAEMLSLADTAAAHGFQVATHAIGDAANAQIIWRL